MQVKPGSNNYFKSNEEELARIKKITTGDKNWFVRKACKVMKSIRKLIYGHDKLREEFDARLKATRESITNNQYKANIEKYVDGVVKNCQEEAFNAFKAGMPQLNAIISKSTDFIDEIGNHPDLNKALNAISGKVKLEACSAFVDLPKILNEINTDTADTPFLQYVKELKDQFKDDGEAKKHLGSNLKNMTTAMSWDWKKTPLNVLPLERVLSDNQKKNVDLIKHIVVWQNKLKDQQVELLKALPSVELDDKSTILKRFGFLKDQIDAVKSVSERQMKEVSSQKKLEASLIGFLSDKVKNELAIAEKTIGESKTGSMLGSSKSGKKNNKKEIAEVESKLKSMRWWNEDDTVAYQTRKENLKGLEEDLKARKVLHKTLKSEWTTSFDPIRKEIKREHKVYDKLKGNSQAKISTLIDLLKDSEKLTKDLKMTEKVYVLKDKWDLIHFRNKQGAPLGEEFKWLTDFDANIKEFKKDLDAIPKDSRDGIAFKNFFGTKDIITYQIAIEKLDELLMEINEQKLALKK